MTAWEKVNISLPDLVRTLDSYLIVYGLITNSWFRFPIQDTIKDWATCLYCESAKELQNSERLPIFFLHLDSTCNNQTFRGSLKLLDFLRYLRLSNNHPKSWTFAADGYNLWQSPVVCLSFQTKEQIIKREPEGLVLYAPSTHFIRLPFFFGKEWLSELKQLKPTESSEIVNYVNATKVINIASHHNLANEIGPCIILKSLGSSFEPVLNKEFTVAHLQEIFWQRQQEEDTDIYNYTPKSTIVDLLIKIKDLANSVALNRGGNTLLVVDDQNNEWKNVWFEIFGIKGGLELLDSVRINDLISVVDTATFDKIPFDTIKKYALLILDLRLNPILDQNSDLENITGYKLLRYIREYDESIPIIVFTSSQRWSFLQRLKAAGADAVCVKPTRFDQASILLEKLLYEIYILLQPEYQYLQDIYYELSPNQIVDEREDLMRWVLSAWREMRYNLKIFVEDRIENDERDITRVLALSIARTVGLASEYIEEECELRSSYTFAVKFIRDACSHINCSTNINTDVGYVAIGLASKLLSSLIVSPVDGFIDDIKYTKQRLITPTYEYLKNISFPNLNNDQLQRKLRGAIQVATLAYAILELKDMNLLPQLTQYLHNVQETADNIIKDVCKTYSIKRIDLEPALDKLTHLDKWLGELQIP